MVGISMFSESVLGLKASFMGFIREATMSLDGRFLAYVPGPATDKVLDIASGDIYQTF
jgi:hypothetical protein